MEIFEATPLFEDVQRRRVFTDSKTFVDCRPRKALGVILEEYERRRSTAANGVLNLAAFIEDNFEYPPSAPPVQDWNRADIEEHVCRLWRSLWRPPEQSALGGSMLDLPFPYVMAGGRFRELYYWDTFFIMLGLRVSGERILMHHFTQNIAALIRKYGFMPNGNRSYYLTRSQPPFFALMVELLAEENEDTLLEFIDEMQHELDFWMDRSIATKHVVQVPGGWLNRYHDQKDFPRPESHLEDELIAQKAIGRNPADVYRELRSAAESGWDFSSRWLDDSRCLETIRTTTFVPVDLNALLHRLETVLARTYRRRCRPGDNDKAVALESAAERRKQLILQNCWSPRDQFFCDFDLQTAAVAEGRLTLAGVAPLFMGIATPEQAGCVARVLESKFLKAGGLVTTLVNSGQQWDEPNGWAPLHWMAIRGLERYGLTDLAGEIAQRWIAINCAVYERTGKLMEKYNVEDTGLLAGGGEYPNQDGFGWTNGVLLDLLTTWPRRGRRIVRAKAGLVVP